MQIEVTVRILTNGGEPIVRTVSVAQEPQTFEVAPVPATNAPKLGDLAEEVIAELTPSWRGSETAISWRRTFDMYLVELSDIPIDQLDTPQIVGALKKIWATKYVTAAKCRERLERVLDYARAQGFRTGDNPARWKGHLSFLLAPRAGLITNRHHRALPYQEIPAFMRELRKSEHTAPKALQWNILTASRIGMSINATWDEISGDVWTVPGPRMKEGIEHRVPLSSACVDLLADLSHQSKWLFPAPRGGSSISHPGIKAVMTRMGDISTIHGFRSSFRDWAGDCTAFPREVAEEALAHAVGGAAERAYRRSDALEKRRVLMQAWADFCLSCRE